MRLTNTIRTDTRNLIIEKLINPKIKKLKDQLKIIAQDIADNIYPKKTNEWISGAPKGGLPLLGSISIKMDKDTFFYHELIENRSVYNKINKFSLPNPVKVLAQDQYNSEYHAPKKHIKKLKYILIKLNTIQQQKEELRLTLNSALWACNTKKQLEENYPDLTKYLPKHEQQTKALAITNNDVLKVIKAAA